MLKHPLKNKVFAGNIFPNSPNIRVFWVCLHLNHLHSWPLPQNPMVSSASPPNNTKPQTKHSKKPDLKHSKKVSRMSRLMSPQVWSLASSSPFPSCRPAPLGSACCYWNGAWGLRLRQLPRRGHRSDEAEDDERGAAEKDLGETKQGGLKIVVWKNHEKPAGSLNFE